MSHVLDEWWKKLGRSDEQHRQLMIEWEDFVAQQERLWTPSDLRDKCCLRWLGHGKKPIQLLHHHHHYHHHSHHNMDHSHQRRSNGGPTDTASSRSCDEMIFACSGGCHKLHPSITLHYDEDEHCCVAVVSHPLDPFEVYFERLVQQNIAIRITPFYFKLRGYVRENYYRIRRQEYSGDADDDMIKFGSHLVNIAVGALAKSDYAQKAELESAILAKRKQQQPPLQSYGPRLEDVLEIVRLHRLGDDLDIMSIYCLRLVNKCIGQIASKIAKERIQTSTLTVNPLVDGCTLSGFSVFRRRRQRRRRRRPSQQQHDHDDEDPENHFHDNAINPFHTTIIQGDDRKLVEYSECEKIILEAAEDDDERTTCHGHNIDGGGGSTGGSELGVFRPTKDSFNDFSWNCEELSFATLERDWGDIAIHEYVGQKLLLFWNLPPVDALLLVQDSGSSRDGSSLLQLTTTTSSRKSLPLANLGLNAAPRKGNRTWRTPMVDFNLDIISSDAVQVDDVTVSYSGRIRLENVRINFACLARAYARNLELVLKNQHEQILETRPLLDHEIAYRQLVSDVAKL